MENKYQVLEHTADIGFEAYGRTREEALANAALALVSLISNPDQIRISDEKRLQVHGEDWEQVLVRYLSEILFVIDAESFLPAEVDVFIPEEYYLTVVLRGEQRTNDHEIRIDVKAITYHQLLFEKTETGYRIRVFVDI